MSSEIKHWRIPTLISLLLNLLLFAYVGQWYNGFDFTTPKKLISLRYVKLVRPPVAAKQQRRVVRHIDRALPAEPKVNDQTASTGGSRPAPSVTHPHYSRSAAAAPVTTPVPPQQQDADRDPLMPTVAPAMTLHITRNPDRPLPLPVPQIVIPKPTQIASVSATSPTTSLAPGRMSSGQTVSSGSAFNQFGAGGNGNGAGSGTGNGNGGILPFGLNGGRGGSGTHRIVYVIDVSRSMTTRLPKAVEELRACLAGLSRDDLFDIIAFGGHTRTMEDYLEPATSDSISEANSFLQDLRLMDGTDLESALTQALDMEHVNEIVVLTDGVPTWGETDLPTLAREIRNRNIDHVRIDTIGLVGIDPEGKVSKFDAANLLHQIARDSGGDFRLVPLGVVDDD